MANRTQHPTLVSRDSLRTAVFAPVLLLVLIATTAAYAQTFTVLHNFTGGADGAYPVVGVTEDSAGNLYGTAPVGGLAGGCDNYGCGTVYKLAPHGSGFLFSPLYTFTGGSDGAFPFARVIFGPNGTLYGTTYQGGGEGTGVVYNLHPPAHASGRVFSPWDETVLYQFGDVNDGNNPEGDLLFDAAGDIYGTTFSGGIECEDTVTCGTVYKLTHTGSNWTESILYKFTNESGTNPLAGVVSDQAGNLYGTTSNLFTVFELVHSASGWTESTLYQTGFMDGVNSPAGGVIFDPSGNLYGTTELGGTNGAGTVFELTPVGGGWNQSTLYSFTGEGNVFASVVRDASGNLYGATCNGGVHSSGSVFKLTPVAGGWTETDLYDFTGGDDGYCPMGNVLLDAQDNIYDTAYAGGTHGYGTVFEITP